MADREDRDIDHRVGLAMQSLSPADHEWQSPPPELWGRIAARVAQEARPTATVGSVVPLRQRRLVTGLGLLGLAASVALAVVMVSRTDDGPRELATAPLSNDGLAQFTVTPSGQARLVSDHGREYLDIHIDHAPAESGGYLELWMIDREVRGMVSLGPFHGDGRYEVPVGVDSNQFPVVDLSVEPTDGQPTHSGRSVVRGVLPEVQRRS